MMHVLTDIHQLEIIILIIMKKKEKTVVPELCLTALFIRPFE